MQHFIAIEFFPIVLTEDQPSILEDVRRNLYNEAEEYGLCLNCFDFAEGVLGVGVDGPSVSPEFLFHLEEITGAQRSEFFFGRFLDPYFAPLFEI